VATGTASPSYAACTGNCTVGAHQGLTVHHGAGSAHRGTVAISAVGP
jgi:hypothetical protein